MFLTYYKQLKFYNLKTKTLIYIIKAVIKLVQVFYEQVDIVIILSLKKI